MRAHFTYIDNGLATQRRLELEENDMYDGHVGGCDAVLMKILIRNERIVSGSSTRPND